MRSDVGNFWWVIAVSLILSPSLSFANDAGHSMAAKFAHASDGEREASPTVGSDVPSPEIKTADRGEADGDSLDARLKADEEAMLARAREEAEQRRASAKKAAEAIVRAAQRAKHRRVAAQIAERRLAFVQRKAEEVRAAKEREAALAAKRRAFAKRLADRREARRRSAELEEARRVAQAERREKDEALRKVALAKEEAARAAKRAADLAKALADERRAKALKATQERKAAELKERKAQERLAAHEKKRQHIARQKVIQREPARQKQPVAEGSVPDEEYDDADETGSKSWEEMKAAREAEARRLSKKLARVRARREGEDKDMDTGYSGLGMDPSKHADRRPDNFKAKSHSVEPARTRKAVDSDRPETRATILLVMEPGKRGIRRFKKTADPILCLGKTCYVGNGSERAALSMSRRKAFGPANTIGQRAGRCGRSLVCVFRDVDVGRGSFEIQPIDLRIMRHDRREKVKAELDWSCQAVGGSLRCLRPVHSRTYRAWIVPERIARRAGASAITAAIESNLRDWAETALPRKR